MGEELAQHAGKCSDAEEPDSLLDDFSIYQPSEADSIM